MLPLNSGNQCKVGKSKVKWPPWTRRESAGTSCKNKKETVCTDKLIIAAPLCQSAPCLSGRAANINRLGAILCSKLSNCNCTTNWFPVWDEPEMKWQWRKSMTSTITLAMAFPLESVIEAGCSLSAGNGARRRMRDYTLGEEPEFRKVKRLAEKATLHR